MAMATNTINGKAFEYACLQALVNRFKAEGKNINILDNKPFKTAKASFLTVSSSERIKLVDASNTAINLLIPLEPRILGGNGMAQIEISADSIARGKTGDVRDVICVRDDENGWKIGISCKHNHEALRHPRITESKDFGFDWMGIRCSEHFIKTITPITDSLIKFGNGDILWKSIDHKWDRYYVPILHAYLDEIKYMCENNPDVPEKLLSYFFGANDFYKVIMKSKSRTTTIEGFNMHGTLNMPCGKNRAMIKVPLIKMPTRLIDATFKRKSKTTLILTFDGGWSISMRLHNKDDVAKPTSLAWDVNLVGFPTSTYVNTHSWDELTVKKQGAQLRRPTCPYKGLFYLAIYFIKLLDKVARIESCGSQVALKSSSEYQIPSYPLA